MKLISKLIMFFLIIISLTACTTDNDHLPNFSYIHKPQDINRGIPAGPQEDPNPNYIVPVPYECIHAPYKNHVNNMICGYSCQTYKGYTKCALFPNQRCLKAPGSGYIACGFDCRRSHVDGSVNCGSRVEDTCVETLAGKIICGLSCRVECGSVVCEESPSFRPAFPMQNADTNLGYKPWLNQRAVATDNQFPPPNARVRKVITCPDC